MYGASYKHSHFDLSFVPDVHHRDEGGAFITDDLHLTDTVRVTAGARLDWFDTFGLFASPRLGIRYEPSPGQTIRATYNRAYSAPSTVESYADFTSSIDIPLGAMTFPVPITTVGSLDLRPQTIDAFEIGYNGVVNGRFTVNAAVYHQRSKGVINLTTAEFYGSCGSAARMATTADRARRARIAETVRVGECREPHGVGVRGRRRLADWSRLLRDGKLFVPVASGRHRRQRRPAASLNIPPHQRINLSLSGTHRRLVGSFTTSYTDRAFWTDVLAIQGWTDRFWLIGASAGVNFKGDRFTWLVKGTNLADRRIQHHIFGDIIQRRVMTELRFKL